MGKKQKSIRTLVKSRKFIQFTIGALIYSALAYFQFSIWWVVGIGSAIGIVWGKVFCRWMCPMGIIMEFIMKLNPNSKFQSMYQYHKLGCPIAWLSGLFNKISFYKIQLNKDTCKSCGLCDKACYMPTLNAQKFSLYKQGKTNPAENYSCSKCLQCVAECPNGSLSYGLSLKK